MPELPEVQTIVNDLNKKVVGRRITGVWFDFPKMFKKSPLALEKIKGKKILGVGRRGKNILIYLSSADKRGHDADQRGKNIRENQRLNQRESAYVLLIHQKLTGHLLVGKWKITCQASGVRCQVIPLEPKELATDPQNQYIHLIFYLDNGQMLGLSDLRKFAKVILGKKEQIENLPELKKIGPEVNDPKLTLGKFKDLILKERRKIKQVLMDQEVIAGIGNIYSDEILWKAKIHPFEPTNKLSEKELGVLYAAMKKVLKKAVKMRGTSISDFRDTAGKKGKYAEIRSVYQRENEPCPRCKTKIKRVKLGGRSAHFCPSCQKL